MSLASPAASERFKSHVLRMLDEARSQSAVARRLGISQAYVSRVARGEVDRVQQGTIRKVEETMGWEIDAEEQATTDPLVAQRFAALVEQIGQEHGAPARGWQTRVASAIGMDRSYLTKLLNGERQIGIAAAESIAKALGIDFAFFTSPGPVPNHRELRAENAIESIASHERTAARLDALVRAAVERLGGQQEASNRLGLSQPHISRILSREQRAGYVHGRTREAVASAMGFDPCRFDADPALLPSEWAEQTISLMPPDPDSRRSEGLAALIADIGRTGTRGWKQDFAQRIGVSPGYISKFLTAPYPNLSEHTAHQIEMRLGLKQDALLNGARAEDIRSPDEIGLPYLLATLDPASVAADPMSLAMHTFDALSPAAREAFLAWARTR